MAETSVVIIVALHAREQENIIRWQLKHFALNDQLQVICLLYNIYTSLGPIEALTPSLMLR